jgi:hypothetical protein
LRKAAEELVQAVRESEDGEVWTIRKKAGGEFVVEGPFEKEEAAPQQDKEPWSRLKGTLVLFAIFVSAGLLYHFRLGSSGLVFFVVAGVLFVFVVFEALEGWERRRRMRRALHEWGRGQERRP